MSNLAILGASHLGPEGFGNDLRGLCPWPSDRAGAFRRGDLRQLHWSTLFASEAARFGRMDLMCRLGLMAVELLEVELGSLPTEQRDRIAICVETYFGALATDVDFLRAPRPTLFTYSLPSTVIGEVCIRYRMRGPVLCLISPQARGTTILGEAADLIEAGDVEACLCLACEAVDSRTEESFSWPHGLPAEEWHGSGLLLGKAEGRAREYRVGSGTLLEQCLRLCRG